MRNIVLLCGPSGAGKSAVSRCMGDYQIISFARPIKRMLSAIGIDNINTGKEHPRNKLCGKSVRFAMQTLGTQWGRETIGSDIWNGLWLDEVSRSWDDVVADDVRFQDEIEAAKRVPDAKVYLFEIQRKNCEYSRNHLSEFGVIGDKYMINNDNSPRDAAQEILRIVG